MEEKNMLMLKYSQMEETMKNVNQTYEDMNDAFKKLEKISKENLCKFNYLTEEKRKMLIDICIQNETIDSFK